MQITPILLTRQQHWYTLQTSSTVKLEIFNSEGNLLAENKWEIFQPETYLQIWRGNLIHREYIFYRLPQVIYTK